MGVAPPPTIHPHPLRLTGKAIVLVCHRALRAKIEVAWFLIKSRKELRPLLTV